MGSQSWILKWEKKQFKPPLLFSKNDISKAPKNLQGRANISITRKHVSPCIIISWCVPMFGCGLHARELCCVREDIMCLSVSLSHRSINWILLFYLTLLKQKRKKPTAFFGETMTNFQILTWNLNLLIVRFA